MVSILIKLLFLSSLSSAFSSEDKQVLIKIQPRRLFDTFGTILSVEYLEKLANEFAKIASKLFIDGIIKHKKDNLSDGSRTLLGRGQDHHKKLLDDREALKLMHEPSLDGDNLSLELSDHEANLREKNVSVVEVKKINGVYYRRLLRL